MNTESFNAWRKKFDAEMRELEGKERAKAEENRRKLTGKQLFEADSTLYLQEGLEEGSCSLFSSGFTSWLPFHFAHLRFPLSLGDVVVEVDESLFENLEDEIEEQDREESQE